MKNTEKLTFSLLQVQEILSPISGNFLCIFKTWFSKLSEVSFSYEGSPKQVFHQYFLSIYSTEILKQKSFPPLL